MPEVLSWPAKHPHEANPPVRAEGDGSRCEGRNPCLNPSPKYAHSRNYGLGVRVGAFARKYRREDEGSPSIELADRVVRPAALGCWGAVATTLEHRRHPRCEHRRAGENDQPRADYRPSEAVHEAAKRQTQRLLIQIVIRSNAPGLQQGDIGKRVAAEQRHRIPPEGIGNQTSLNVHILRWQPTDSIGHALQAGRGRAHFIRLIRDAV